MADGVEHHRFALDGTWDRVLTALQAQADAFSMASPSAWTAGR